MCVICDVCADIVVVIWIPHYCGQFQLTIRSTCVTPPRHVVREYHLIKILTIYITGQHGRMMRKKKSQLMFCPWKRWEPDEEEPKDTNKSKTKGGDEDASKDDNDNDNDNDGDDDESEWVPEEGAESDSKEENGEVRGGIDVLGEDGGEERRKESENVSAKEEKTEETTEDDKEKGEEKEKEVMNNGEGRSMEEMHLDSKSNGDEIGKAKANEGINGVTIVGGSITYIGRDQSLDCDTTTDKAKEEENEKKKTEKQKQKQKQIKIKKKKKEKEKTKVKTKPKFKPKPKPKSVLYIAGDTFGVMVSEIDRVGV